jgi:ADP-ribose pyrophosphatase YjhB (NUDIX family)
MTTIISFCVFCGEKLKTKQMVNNAQQICSPCNRIAYSDPKLVAGILLIEGNKVLLVQRDIEPGRGKWAIPCGYVNRGEEIEKAAIRELYEETGIEANVGALVGLYSKTDDPIALAIYTGIRGGGFLQAREETQNVGFWLLSELPDLAFTRDLQIINDWFSQSSR